MTAQKTTVSNALFSTHKRSKVYINRVQPQHTDFYIIRPFIVVFYTNPLSLSFVRAGR
ncbi:hypothetical protein EX30DRAFT_341162 [Ascodesmis nigricans]|uniref:Uncharacterized protein n=1 Tax=Ascodesmis nigricans TaxID=341454 RepID=A0A4S2MWA0_9PEZI|nr:hypothetical protein EX30DRAFT_341162 [Ascodesmis nigricans]